MRLRMKASLYLPFLLALAGSAPCRAQPAGASDHGPGARIYRSLCAICHQPDGSGMATLQPRLMDDPVVAGDPATLIRILLLGPAAVLPRDRPHYQNVMPALAGLPDRDIANVLTFVRKTFGHGASAITADQVAAQRAAP
jgi:mono/diheme cytochrome c family protein